MRKAGALTAQALHAGGSAVRPGVTTAEIDHVVHDFITRHGAVPSFLGYGGFPASACISVNDEVIHGIPGGKVIREGDIVSIDVGAKIGGYLGLHLPLREDIGRGAEPARRDKTGARKGNCRGTARQPDRRRCPRGAVDRRAAWLFGRPGICRAWGRPGSPRGTGGAQLRARGTWNPAGPRHGHRHRADD